MVAAQCRGVTGLAVDGAVRDVEAIQRRRSPVFSRGLAIGACTKERFGTLNRPIIFGGVVVHPGDVIVGNGGDGLPVTGQERLDTVIAAAAERQCKEETIIEQLQAGRSTVDLLNLPPLPEETGRTTPGPLPHRRTRKSVGAFCRSAQRPRRRRKPTLRHAEIVFAMRVNIGQTFNFLPIPTDIHFGCGALKALPDRIHGLGASKAFLVTDPGVKEAGILSQAERQLQAASIEFAVCDRVKPDSGSSLIDETAGELKRSGCDVVVGIGGGSSLDTAKAVAAVATNPGSALSYVGLHKLRNRPLPTVAIPTTAGTGSEVTLWSVFTDETRAVKTAIGSVMIYPSVAICDPELTLGLPPALTAATGMDALAHAIECFTNNACQPVSASLALTAMELIGANLRSAVLSGRNIEARYAMMLASTMAGIAMNSTRLGLAHAFAMPLGSWDLRVPHGVVLAILLPLVMEYNCLAEPDRFVEVARALGVAVGGLSIMDAARRSVEAVRGLSRDIGIPEGLSGFGVREGHVGKVVEEAMKSGNVPVNPRRADADALALILRQAL